MLHAKGLRVTKQQLSVFQFANRHFFIANQKMKKDYKLSVFNPTKQAFLLATLS
jgi:hypothetical protein